MSPIFSPNRNNQLESICVDRKSKQIIIKAS